VDRTRRRFLAVCEQAARAAGDVLLDWQGRAGVQEKGPADLVTDADFAAQQAVYEAIRQAFPQHGFRGEEAGSPGGGDSDYCWYVDPLDGTTNYVHGLPHYCVSVGLAHAGQVQVGTVLDPVSGKCFTAVRGDGARLDGQALRVSRTTDLEQALVAISFAPHVSSTSPEVKVFLRVLDACQAIRRTGSSALNLCYLAAGWIDGYWSRTVHPWDIAAGVLMVEEAGGVVTAPDGGPLDLDRAAFVAAATPQLHARLLALLQSSGGGEGPQR